MSDTIIPNPNRIPLDEAYMQMAEIWAKRSKANRKQVGALIVKDRQIISDGYNGMPAGEEDDTCEEWYFDPSRDREPGYTGELRSKDDVLHAESNALAKIAQNGGVGAQGATLYVTMSPCKECAKLIKQAGIARVVFRELYRDTRGIESLIKRGIKVEHLSGTADVQPQPSLAAPQTRSTAALDRPRPSEISRLRSLAAVAGKPVPVQGPTFVEQPPITPVEGPQLVQQPSVPVVDGPVVIDDVAAALADAGITLVNGVPVERPATTVKQPVQENDAYRSSFF